MYKNIYKRIKKNKGLTLVELMVVISIFLVISGVAIFDYGGFRSTVSLQNITDDIALSIRKSQGFAIGARAISSNFYNSYGMHFSNSSTQSNLTASNKSFLMFWAPLNLIPKRYEVTGNNICGDPSNRCIELFNITSTDVIKEISINDHSIILPADSYLDIIFTRPDPRASFCYRTNVSANTCNSTVISNASITISNGQSAPNEKTKTISIQNTGQISISN